MAHTGISEAHDMEFGAFIRIQSSLGFLTLVTISNVTAEF